MVDALRGGSSTGSSFAGDSPCASASPTGAEATWLPEHLALRVSSGGQGVYFGKVRFGCDDGPWLRQPVWKSYSEFARLRAALLRAFPELTSLPPLPPKAPWYRRTNWSAAALERRRAQLESFLQACAATPVVVQSAIWRQFVDPTRWQRQSGDSGPTGIGGYTLGTVIGRGSFSEVRYAALSPPPGAAIPVPAPSLPGVSGTTSPTPPAVVAVKILDRDTGPAAVQARHEMGLQSLLDHPNVVRLVNSGIENGRVFMAMEVADGGDLLDVLQGTNGLAEETAVGYFAQLALGLYYLRHMMVAHRDLKPSNLLVSKGQILKISDFGFANRQHPGGRLTARCGSPFYAAPEVLTADSYDGFAADVWSAGVILFAMLAGERAFDRTTVDSFSPNARSLIRRMLTRQPDRRASIADVVAHPLLAGRIAPEAIAAVDALPVPPIGPGEDVDAVRATFGRGTPPPGESS